MKTEKQFIRTLILVFVLLGGMIFFTFHSFYQSSKDNIEALGKSNLKTETALIENYLNRGADLLWVTADTVDNMMQTGKSNEEILEYLCLEAKHEAEQIDENFTGVYGYINGEYLDGIGWEPPKDYVPTERNWYVEAKEAAGNVTISAPYLDAQTNTVMISVCKLLSDNKSVLSLDLGLNEIQKQVEQIQLDNTGYGFIIDGEGLVVAHLNQAEKGKVYPLNDEQRALLLEIYSIQDGSTKMSLDGEDCTIFINQVINDWYIVMVISDTKLFAKIKNQLLINILVCFVVFVLIVLFCSYTYRRMKIHQRNDEASRIEVNRLNANIINALAGTIDAKDRYTSGHSQRVAKYSKELAKRMGKSEEEQNLIYYAGLLHDVGKIRVPDEVINKPGKLTNEEFNLIKIHPISSFHILKDIYNDKQVAMGAKFHHEKYDGTGYPNGLSGENIPEIARIIGIADAYDAMASNRSYRKALPQAVVRSEIEKNTGTQFDPEIARIMLQLIDEDKDYQMCQQNDMNKNILVIDNDFITCELIQEFLSDNPNYTVLDSNNYAEASHILSETNIHLIILDVVMPEMNGFEMYRKIKNERNIPAIFISGDKDINHIYRALELGAEDYISKPISATALKETVQGVLNNHSVIRDGSR